MWNTARGTVMTDVQHAQQSRTRRRSFLAATAAGGTAAVAAPFVANAQSGKTTTWKVQTSWPAGVGLDTCRKWCGTIKEKTGGELEFKGFAAKEVVGDLEM